jgi:UDP-N-acetyl-D-glucosamine dehydrogenase
LQRVGEALNGDGKSIKGSRVCILGIAYKKDVDDPRESPAFEIMEMLERHGADLSYNDPHVPVLPAMRHHQIRMNSSPLTDEFLASRDCVLIITEHTAFDFARIAKHAKLIVDTRNATGGVAAPKARIVKA